MILSILARFLFYAVVWGAVACYGWLELRLYRIRRAAVASRRLQVETRRHGREAR